MDVSSTVSCLVKQSSPAFAQSLSLLYRKRNRHLSRRPRISSGSLAVICIGLTVSASVHIFSRSLTLSSSAFLSQSHALTLAELNQSPPSTASGLSSVRCYRGDKRNQTLDRSLQRKREGRIERRLIVDEKVEVRSLEDGFLRSWPEHCYCG